MGDGGLSAAFLDSVLIFKVNRGWITAILVISF